MSDTRNSDVPLTGIAFGAVALALVVLFAVFLPKAVGDTANASAITMPTTLPGGYKSATDVEAWKGNPSMAGQEAQVVKAVQAEIDFGDTQLKKTTGGGFGNALDDADRDHGRTEHRGHEDRQEAVDQFGRDVHEHRAEPEYPDASRQGAIGPRGGSRRRLVEFRRWHHE